MQKALIVGSNDSRTLSCVQLNDHLEKGWAVVSTTPFGVGGEAYFCGVLVIIEKYCKGDYVGE